MTVNDDDPRLKSTQVAAALRTEIEQGRLRPKQRMPPVRQLAEQFGVAGSTIQSALKVLQTESLIHSVGNRGTFVGPADSAQPETADITKQVADLAELVADLVKQVSNLTERVAAIEASR